MIDAGLVENPTAAFFRNAMVRPDALALEVMDAAWTYAALARRAAGIASQVAAMASRLGRPPRIGILSRRNVQTYAALIGTPAGRGSYVPIDPRLPSEALARVCATAMLDAAVVDESSPALPNLALLDVQVEEAFELPPALLADHPYYILFTSGSTGRPKGVIVPARAIAAFLAAIRSMYAFGPGDRFGQYVETTFDISLFELYGAWCAGASLHVVPDGMRAAPDRFISQRELTVWTSTPSLIAALERAGRLTETSLPSLRVAFFCGEALQTRQAHLWQRAAPACAIDNHYGPTEATVACSRQRVPRAVIPTVDDSTTVSIGLPYPGMCFGILSEGSTFLPQGQVGQLAISGPQLALGYLSPETPPRFCELLHPSLGRSRWYLTGDKAVQDAGGDYHFLGRLDFQVKILGRLVELEEVEAALRQAGLGPFVAAVPWPREGAQAHGLVAFVGSPPAADWRTRLSATIPEWMIPSRLIPLSNPPLTTHGKLDRRGLERLLEDEPLEPHRSVDGRTGTEARVAQIWSEILELESVPLNKTFHLLGGDSVGLICLLTALWEEFGESLSADELLREPTVAGIAAALDEVSGGEQ
ncbi:MAG: non-ribosomal peptide synthetase [Deltaproteobacteria bacterium]